MKKYNKLSKHIFSLFYDQKKGIYNTTPKKEITLTDLVKIYQSDHIKDISDKILKTNNPEEKKALKKQLPFFTPYGTFESRKNSNIKHFNHNLIAFDFDGMTKEGAKELKEKISTLDSCLLCVISPRQKGVKALIKVNATATPNKLYDTLKHNSNSILKGLNIIEYIDYLDTAQFVLCQPMFIAFDINIYHNKNAVPFDAEIKEYKPPIIEDHSITSTPPTAKNRIEAYLLSATSTLTNELLMKSEGERHRSIIKVRLVASWLHYAPTIRQEVKSILLEAVVSMYGGQTKAKNNNAIKSFNDAFEGALNKSNSTIEKIISEVSNNSKKETA